jgi:hypothetical protein
MQKYIGRMVEVVYLDRHGKLTQRRIRVIGIKDGMVKAFCYDRRSLRIFNEVNILAFQQAV